MAAFSILLGSYIRRCGYTNQTFAKLCGVDRTLLQRYISGQRLPHSYEALNGMLERLRITPDERRELEDAFERELIGEERFAQYSIIRELLESFDGMPEETHYEAAVRTRVELSGEPGHRYVQGKRDVLHWIWSILGGEASKEHGEIYMIGQPGIRELDVMLQGCILQDSVTLHQLICVNPEMLAEGGTENIEMLRSILPLLSQSVQYDLRFYYGNPQEHFNAMNVHPNMLITEHYVVRFDTDLSSAFISNEEDVHSFLYQRYKEMERKTRSFIVKHGSVIEMIAYYQNLHPCDHSLQLQPCFAYTLNEDVLVSILREETKPLDSTVKALCSMMADWAEHAVLDHTYANRNFFTKEGLRHFMDTGRILEFPSLFYEPLPFEWRLQMLKTFLAQLQSGLIEGYIVKEDYMRVNGGLVLQLTGGDAVHFILNNPDGSQTVLGLKESGLVQIFREYMEYLKDGRFVETREDTIAWVAQEVERYEASSLEKMRDK